MAQEHPLFAHFLFFWERVERNVSIIIFFIIYATPEHSTPHIYNFYKSFNGLGRK